MKTKLRNMDRPTTITNIKALLSDPYVSPEERDTFLPNLDKLTDKELDELRNHYRQKIDSLLNLHYLLSKVGNAVRKTHISRRLSEAAKVHPLYDLAPEKITEEIGLHLLDYVNQGVNLKEEYDIYQDAQRHFREMDDDVVTAGIGPADIRQHFLDGFRNCNEFIPNDQARKTIGSYVRDYDQKFPADTPRTDIQRGSYVSASGLSGASQKMLQDVLSMYDGIVFTYDLINDGGELVEFLDAFGESHEPSQGANKSATTPVHPATPSITTPPKPFVEPVRAALLPTPPVEPVQTPKPVPKMSPVSKRVPKSTPTAPVTTVPSDSSLLVRNEVDTYLTEHQKEVIGKPVQALAAAAQGKDLYGVLASLRIIAERGILSEVIKREPKLEDLLATAYQKKGLLGELESLKLTPTSPQHVKHLVQGILEINLRLKENESAHIAVDLVNLANRKNAVKMQPWAYFDLSTGQYHWL